MRQVILLGRSGSDGEFRSTASGVSIFNFSLCVSEKKKDGTTDSHWFDIIVFGRSAEISKEQIKKGCEVLVIGQIQTRSWADKETQKKMTKVEIVADRVRVTAYKREGMQANEPVNTFDDIPF